MLNLKALLGRHCDNGLAFSQAQEFGLGGWWSSDSHANIKS
jgi:hypothetical protein